MTITADLSYPVGRLDPRAPITPEMRSAAIEAIAACPAKMREGVAGLSEAQLDTPYRPGGWTVRQVIHHIPDSHMNAYVRMKLAATEESPTVKTYEESRWAELPEARSGRVEMSLALIEALHQRWVAFLRALPEAHLRRAFMHAEWGKVTIEESITMYSWHCRHHAAHIAGVLGRTTL